MSLRLTHVVAAVIRHESWVLISQRPLGKNLGGKWEFPGGKVQHGETETEALTRELYEELGLVHIQMGRCLDTVRDSQAHHTLVLSFYDVTLPILPVQYPLGTDTYTGREGQRVEWRTIPQLQALDFPPANQAILYSLMHAVGA